MEEGIDPGNVFAIPDLWAIPRDLGNQDSPSFLFPQLELNGWSLLNCTAGDRLTRLQT
jgi:hypothetical protein